MILEKKNTKITIKISVNILLLSHLPSCDSSVSHLSGHRSLSPVGGVADGDVLYFLAFLCCGVGWCLLTR